MKTQTIALIVIAVMLTVIAAALVAPHIWHDEPSCQPGEGWSGGCTR